MGAGDYLPPSRKRRYDPKHADAIKKGGKKAKKIHDESHAEHQSIEVPQAEEELMKALEEMEK